jgi:hypothetical protein
VSDNLNAKLRAPTICIPSHIFLVGYTVVAVNHVVQSKFQGAISDFSLRKRDGVIIVKRLTVVLDEAGEKGCGLVRAFCMQLITEVSFDYCAITATP